MAVRFLGPQKNKTGKQELTLLLKKKTKLGIVWLSEIVLSGEKELLIWGENSSGGANV